MLFLIEFLQFLLCKLNGLGKTHRKRARGRTENFARPFTTNKLFERIRILDE